MILMEEFLRVKQKRDNFMIFILPPAENSQEFFSVCLISTGSNPVEINLIRSHTRYDYFIQGSEAACKTQ